MARIRLKSDDRLEPIAVELKRGTDAGRDTYQAVIGSTSFEVEIEGLESGSGWIRVHAKVLPFHVVRRSDRVLVWLQGRSYVLQLAERGAQRSVGGPAVDHDGELTAAMPGTILKVHVAVGDEFEAHAPLIVMESMKMEMTLSAPHAGRVTEVACAAGDMVEMGRLLARVERVDDDDDA